MRRGPIPYSAEEMRWLEVNRMQVISDYHRGFLAAFPRPDVTAAHLHALRRRKGWKTGRDGARYKGRRNRYGAEEIAFITDRADWPRAQLHSAFLQRFSRHSALSLSAFKGLCKREGVMTGRTGRIEKGSAPHNKGKPMPPEVRAKCLPTAFKKGSLPHNTKGHGHERIDKKDGYVVMIVEATNPWTGAATRPIHKHKYLWEQVNGPVPKGHALKCIDGNKLNTDPGNWVAIPRGLLPRLNGRWVSMKYDDAPEELKPTLMLIAKLQHAAAEVRRGGSGNETKLHKMET